jgi:gluconolactonase
MNTHKYKVYFTIAVSLFCFSCNKGDNNIVSSESEVNEPQVIADNLQFAEGPVYHNNNLYFSDIQKNTIYKWNSTEGLNVFFENSGGANGLFFDNSGNLVVCEGANKCISSIDAEGNETVLADSFENNPFNEPNDLWIAPNGNIYFTDPLFSGTMTQPGEYVYCILSSNKQIIKVVVDLVKPNGIVGNADGTILYIADYGASKIYQYTIATDGTLFNKKIFAGIQADGSSPFLCVKAKSAMLLFCMIFDHPADHLPSFFLLFLV